MTCIIIVRGSLLERRLIDRKLSENFSTSSKFISHICGNTNNTGYMPIGIPI